MSASGIVVVGGSHAGLEAAETLRREGFTGSVTVVGDEPFLPYQRPPLSKGLLAGAVDGAEIELPLDPDLDVRWLTGRRAERLDGRAVVLDDGRTLPFDGLVVASGAAARTWHSPVPRGVFALRDLDDALALRMALHEASHKSRRVLVVGGGFLGAEVAATVRGLGLHVTIVESARHLMARSMGAGVGEFITHIHRQEGVDVRLGTTVTDFGPGPQLREAILSDGTVVRADVALLALGTTPNIGWLRDTDLQLDEHGVRCDEYCRALTLGGGIGNGVVVAGDVASLRHPLAPDLHVSLGHWTNATTQAGVAARTLLDPEVPVRHGSVPSFWSEQYNVKIRSVGLPQLADQAVVEHVSRSARQLEVSYWRLGSLIGAATVNRTRQLLGYGRRLAEIIDIAVLSSGPR